MKAARSFDDFNENNDPYREHDFGRIDYYNETFDAWEHPLVGSCKRVMTVMLAEEY